MLFKDSGGGGEDLLGQCNTLILRRCWMANPPASLVWVWYKPEPSARTNLILCVCACVCQSQDRPNYLTDVHLGFCFRFHQWWEQGDKDTGDLTAPQGFTPKMSPAPWSAVAQSWWGKGGHLADSSPGVKPRYSKLSNTLPACIFLNGY